MVVEMHAGLASDGGSKLKMLLTFVDALPNGYGPQGPSLLPSTATRFVALRFLFFVWRFAELLLSCVSSSLFFL
jgi:hypothetical protein